MVERTNGEVSMAVFRYIAHVAERGGAAPSHNDVARLLGVSVGGVQDALRRLVKIGLVQARIDCTNHSRRCYRIVATGHETKGYGLGLDLGDRNVDDVLRERIMEAVEEVAAAGADMNVTRASRQVHVSAARFKRFLCELAAEGRIELRHCGQAGRVACRIVESGLTTAGFDAATVAPPKRSMSLPPPPSPRAPSRRQRRKCMACGTNFRVSGRATASAQLIEVTATR